MWSEMCELIPLTTGLDACIEHDIQQYQNCSEANERNGNIELAKYYQQQANELQQRKRKLDNMHPIKRWWHCETQFRRDQKAREKVIRQHKKQLGIWW